MVVRTMTLIATEHLGETTMKLGLMAGYSGSRAKVPLDIIHHAEKLGYDSVWTAEAYGADAVTTATWILANTRRIRAEIGRASCRERV